jgi:hypothetical protein
MREKTPSLSGFNSAFHSGHRRTDPIGLQPFSQVFMYIT